MRATGIVRRIDDLGRVVVPKEIRRQLRIYEGDALELYTEGNDMVCFKKYSPKKELVKNTDTLIQEVEDEIYNDWHSEENRKALQDARALLKQAYDMLKYAENLE